MIHFFGGGSKPPPYDAIHVITASDEDYFPRENPKNVPFFGGGTKAPPYDAIHVITASDEDYFPRENPKNVPFFGGGSKPPLYMCLTVAEKNYRNINRIAERFNKKMVDFRLALWYHHAVS